MSHNTNGDPIRVAPVDLYGRLHGVSGRLDEIRRELAGIRREYETLRRHPDALDVDTLGDPIAPTDAADHVIADLEHVDSRLITAEYWVAHARGKYATRLKLTEQAADELDQRHNQAAAIERTR